MGGGWLLGAFDFYLYDMCWSDENFGFVHLVFHPRGLARSPIDYRFNALITDRPDSISAHSHN
jgi:hypothetical protein